MVDLESSQIILKRFNRQQDHQYQDYKEFTSRKFNLDLVGFEVPHVSTHLFIVDWQIPEFEDVNVTQDSV